MHNEKAPQLIGSISEGRTPIYFSIVFQLVSIQDPSIEERAILTQTAVNLCKDCPLKNAGSNKIPRCSGAVPDGSTFDHSRQIILDARPATLMLFEPSEVFSTFSDDLIRKLLLKQRPQQPILPLDKAIAMIKELGGRCADLLTANYDIYIEP